MLNRSVFCFPARSLSSPVRSLPCRAVAVGGAVWVSSRWRSVRPCLVVPVAHESVLASLLLSRSGAGIAPVTVWAPAFAAAGLQRPACVVYVPLPWGRGQASVVRELSRLVVKVHG